MANQKSKMSRKRKVGIVLLVLIALPIIYSLVGFTRQAIATHQAKAKVTAARLKAEPAADQKIAQFEAELTNAGIVSSKIASSKVDVCYVNHEDQGWFAANWYQECYLRYVEGFTTALSRDQVKETISISPSIRSMSGPRSTLDKLYPQTCQITENPTSMKIVYINYGVTAQTDYSCVVPDQIQGLFSVRGAIVLDHDLAIKIYKSFSASNIAYAQNEVWFEHDEYYYRENLGCGFDFIFCGNPRSTPAQTK